MPDIEPFSPRGMFHEGWSAEVDDYAIVCGWALKGKLFIVGDVDPEKLNTWMGRLLSEKGVDIFRTKGFISYSGNPRRIVFQGVHMLFTAQPDKEWGNEPRRNQLVFIGRNLNEKEMQEGFDKCLI